MEFDWDNICDKMAKAAEIAEQRKIIELVDMLSDAYSAMENIPQDKEHSDIAMQYAKRMNERAKKMGAWIKPNRITEEDDYFVISNYNFPMYLWAIINDFTYELDNLRIKVLKSKLSPKGIEAFRNKVE